MDGVSAHIRPKVPMDGTLAAAVRPGRGHFVQKGVEKVVLCYKAAHTDTHCHTSTNTLPLNRNESEVFLHTK